MKKALLMGLAVVLVAVLSVGGTLAFLQDGDGSVNVMTVGMIDIDQLEYERAEIDGDSAKFVEFVQGKGIHPAVYGEGYTFPLGPTLTLSKDTVGAGVAAPRNALEIQLWDSEALENERDKIVVVDNVGADAAYVRTCFAFEQGSLTLDEWKEAFYLNRNTTEWTWSDFTGGVKLGDETYVIVTATYNKALDGYTTASPSLLQCAMSETVGNDVTESFNGSCDIYAVTQAVQTVGFESPESALNRTFGAVDATVFENMERFS